MDRIKVAYSYLEQAKKSVNALMRQGVKEYQPIRLGWEECKPLKYVHRAQDTNGQWIEDTTLPPLHFNWDTDQQEWVIDRDKYKVDTTK